MLDPTPNARWSDPRVRVALQHAAELTVLGLPVRFESNEPEVLNVAAEAFVTSAEVAHGQSRDGGPPLTVRIMVGAGAEEGHEHARITARVPHRGRLVLSGLGSFGVADVSRHDAVARVSPALLADRQRFRYGMVEALTLFLVTHFDRQPIHAAAVARGDRAILLAGPSGVGKSSLSYAAMCAGLEVLADEAVYVQRVPRLHVWGLRRFLHLPQSAGTYFPELRSVRPVVQATGKPKIEVDVRASRPMRTAPVAERVGLCVLTRGSGESRLEPLPGREAASALGRDLEGGFDLFAEVLEDCVVDLARRGCWRLSIVSPPHTLVPLVHRMLDELE